MIILNVHLYNNILCRLLAGTETKQNKETQTETPLLKDERLTS
jgi:hypothetical protein